MKKFNAVILALVAILVFAAMPAFAQATLSSTTTSAAVTADATTISLTAVTNILAPANPLSNGSGDIGTPSGTQNYMLYMDREFMPVLSVNTSAKTVKVSRGSSPTRRSAHLSGATVYFGPRYYFTDYDRAGSCTSALEKVLPVINPTTGGIFDCRDNGLWFQTQLGTASSVGEPLRQFCTGVVGTAETEFLNGVACSGATTATGRQVISSPGVIANLQVFSSAAAVGGASKDVAVVFKNGSATSLTCTIAAAGTTCSDVSHAVTVVAGDVITFRFVTATSDTAANVSMGVEKY